MGKNASTAHPLKILPVLGGRLELYVDHLIYRRDRVLAQTTGIPYSLYTLHDVECVEIEEGFGVARRNLRLRLKDRGYHPSEVFVYMTQEDATAWAIKSYVDQTIADKDILPLMRRQANDDSERGDIPAATTGI
jgi:hypothetical protein